MADLAKPFGSIDTSICLTGVQRVLLELGLPILDGSAVARHKRSARSAMLRHAVQWPLLALALLVGFQSLGGHWLRTGTVALASLTLGGLFTWLTSVADLQWCTSDYAGFRLSHAVPENVAAVADAVQRAGVDPQLIQVEYLKHDPILFVQEPDSPFRYDLVIW